MARLRSLPAFALVMAACTGAGAGGGGGAIATEYGFNVRTIPAGARTPAPPVEGEAVREGDVVRPSDLAGSVGVVNFWGSWCGPCRREQGFLESLWREYRERGVRFVGVNSRRDPRANANAFLDEFDVTYPSVYDPDSRIAFAFTVRVMPATYVLDRQGGIAAVAVGAFRSEADLRRLLDDMLAEAPA